MNDNQRQLPQQSGAVAAVIIFFILLFVFAKWGPSINFSTVTQSAGEPMIVSGTGTTTAVPDIARVSAGIQDSGPNLATVQNNVNKKSQSLVNALKKLGIEDKDIKTTTYYISPQEDFGSNPPVITGYQVSINYTVTIRDLSKINDALVAFPAAGANVVGGVSFDLSDDAQSKAMDAARVDAVKQAKEKAQSLAKASGIILGKIINVSESQGVSPRPLYLTADMAVGAGAAQKSVATPNVQPGSTEINLTVSISYEVR